MRSNLLRASAHRKQGRGTRQLFAEVARRHSPSGAIGHDTSGHIWQGRFKAFPIQRDDHLLTVVRYVERNPLRAGLVARAEDWRWSSLAAAPPAGAPKRRRNSRRFATASIAGRRSAPIVGYRAPPVGSASSRP